MMNWTITIDNQADKGAKPGTNANAVGIVGPSGATMTHEEIKTHPRRLTFRMLDDDKEVYYCGYAVAEDALDDPFSPLDDFGMPNAGCTELQYLEDGAWKTL